MGSSFYAYCSVVALENASAMLESYDNRPSIICAEILNNQAVKALFFFSNMVANMIGFLPFNVPATRGIIDALGKLNPCYSEKQIRALKNIATTRQNSRDFVIALNQLITGILTGEISDTVADIETGQELSEGGYRLGLLKVEKIFNQIERPRNLGIENSEVTPLISSSDPSECLARLGIIAGFMITGVVYLGFAEFIGISMQMADDAHLSSVRYPIMIIEVIVSYLLVFATNFQYGPMIFEHFDNAMNKKVDFRYMTPNQYKLLLFKNFLICIIGTPPMVYMTKYMAKMSLFWVILAAIGSFGFEMGGSLARMKVVQTNTNTKQIQSQLSDTDHGQLEGLVNLAIQLTEYRPED